MCTQCNDITWPISFPSTSPSLPASYSQNFCFLVATRISKGGKLWPNCSLHSVHWDATHHREGFDGLQLQRYTVHKVPGTQNSVTVSAHSGYLNTRRRKEEPPEGQWVPDHLQSSAEEVLTDTSDVFRHIRGNKNNQKTPIPEQGQWWSPHRIQLLGDKRCACLGLPKAPRGWQMSSCTSLPF